MQLDDRFMDNECITCGVVIVSSGYNTSEELRVKHHIWHNELEAWQERNQSIVELAEKKYGMRI